MAYAHCSKCAWGQDDFWSPSYNPLKSLQDWQEVLLDFEHLDNPYFASAGDARACGCSSTTTRRQVVVKELLKAAQHIQGMRFLTEQGAKGKLCPECGSPLVID